MRRLPVPEIHFSPAPLPFFLLALLILLPLPLFGAPPLRPLAGKGVLVILSTPDPGTVITYDFPGVRRRESRALAELPSITTTISLRKSEMALAIFDRREGFARVAVTASGESGWVEIRPGWEVVPWERFLSGRTVRLMKGLREAASRLRQDRAETAKSVGAVSVGSPLPVSAVREDWVLVSNGGGLTGWLRWRDGDGRLLVTVE